MTNKAKIRIGPSNTVGGVVTELGRVYRKARRGDMDMGEAKSLTYVLRELRCALEAGDVDRRLEALEALRPSQPWQRGNVVGIHEQR